MDQENYAAIHRAIKDRGTWEKKQDDWYRLRFTGIRRAFKPYPNAPDQHYPLADTVIEKLKPFYIGQIYANERMATFESQKGLSREMTTMAERDFDYNLKQKSNFENSMMIGIDMHLQAGLCPIKIYWDNKKNQLAYDPIDPLYVIVPQWTEDLQGADWLVHVLRLSKAQYESNPDYDQSLTEQITGRGLNTSMSTVKEQDVAQREGLTYASYNNEIILWECYTKEGDKWVIETLAPTLGYEQPVRPAFGLPYKHGKLPFVALRADISQKGYYSSRGIPEILFKHELDLCKMWNSKLQYLDFFGQPVFKNSSLSPINTTNFQNAPGKILPQGIEPLPPVNAPLDFDANMQFTRALAEDRIRIPDLGTSEQLQGPASNTKGGKTATAVNAIVALSGQSNDMRARVFRLQLGEIYSQSWALRVQYASDDLQYIYDQGISELPLDALNDVYTITPSGSADSWNVGARSQKALAIYQLLFGKPNVNQDELLKWLLENGDDPLLVKRLFQDTGQAQQNQGERQASEIGNMMLGYPVSVKPDDNDQVHLQTLMGFVQRRMQTGEPIPQEFMQLGMQHAMQHVNSLKAKKDKSAPMWNRTLQQAMKMMAQAPPTSPGVMQQAAAQAGGGMPQLPGPAQGGNGDKRPSASMNYKDVPPDIKRQMEAAEGYQPSQINPALELAQNAPKAGAAAPKPSGRQPMAQGGVAGMQQPAQQGTIIPQIHIPPHPAPVVNVPAPVVNVPAPVVHVKAPMVHVHPTPVHVPAPIVNVPPQPPAQVHVHEKKHKNVKIKVKRDGEGNIIGAEMDHEDG